MIEQIKDNLYLKLSMLSQFCQFFFYCCSGQNVESFGKHFTPFSALSIFIKYLCPAVKDGTLVYK